MGVGTCVVAQGIGQGCGMRLGTSNHGKSGADADDAAGPAAPDDEAQQGIAPSSDGGCAGGCDDVQGVHTAALPHDRNRIRLSILEVESWLKGSVVLGGPFRTGWRLKM
jgi:hypothetical protein